MSIHDIHEISKDWSKSEFEKRLRENIFHRVIGAGLPDPPEEMEISGQVSEKVKGLIYGSNSEKIRSVLLLFNLATLLQDPKSNMRFQFDNYKNQYWDIEHIRSVADKPPGRYDERQQWLEHCVRYFESRKDDDEKGVVGKEGKEKKEEEKLIEEMKDFIQLPRAEARDEMFEELFNKVLEKFGEKPEAEVNHGISNLTLLDQNTNRSYKNAVFAVKRERLLERDQAGIFVPLCTRNVFLKCYNPMVDNAIRWGEKDCEGYEEAIIKTLTKFFCGQLEGSR